jgi:glycosyl hydrolase family 114
MPAIRVAAISACCVALLLGAVLLFVGLPGDETNPSRPRATASEPARALAPVLPPANAEWDYQIGGSYPPAATTGVVTRDRQDPPAAGLYNICYLNAFQTQPGESGSWPATVILHSAAGKSVGDPDWPGEYLLDLRGEQRRRTIMTVLQPWLADCKKKGYQAVELDNLDSWTRSHGLLAEADAVAMAKQIVTAAHALGLAVGQKNAAELAATGKQRIGFDFAVVEECQPYDECDDYLSAYGDQVYEVEYTDNGGLRTFRRACADHGNRVSIIYRDRDVVPRGDADYQNRSC